MNRLTMENRKVLLISNQSKNNLELMLKARHCKQAVKYGVYCDLFIL